MSDQDCNTQRELGYRAVIPFYILWDTDLTGNDLRFYGQIEQLESNPNPKVNATFSYQWIANQLGINRRNAINIAKKLKNKGYISRIRIKGNTYIWNTVKKGVLVSLEDTAIVSPNDTLLVSLKDTQNIMKKNKDHKITTTTKSGGNSLSKSKQKKLAFKCADDLRDDDEFLENCDHHMKNNSTGTSPYQRTVMLLCLLKNLLEAGEHFKSKGFVSVKAEKLRLEQEAEAKRKFDEAQNRQHEEKMARWEKELKEKKDQSTKSQRAGGTRSLSEVLKGCPAYANT